MFTPQEVSEKVFPKSSFGAGGYAMGAVDKFLDTLTEDYTALYKENVALKAKLKILAEKVEEYRATEDAMRSTLLTAQKMAAKLVQEAQTEKENLLKEAKKQSLVEFVRHGSELCAQQAAFLNSLPEMQLSPEENAAPAEDDIRQDIMQHFDTMDVETGTDVEEPPVPQDVPAGSAIPNDFKLSLDELKFGRNYTGE